MEPEDYFSPEDFLPLIAKLSKQYTSNESSSVSYETAQMLMESILFCVHEYMNSNGSSMLSANDLSLEIIYEQGLALVKENTKKAKELFCEIEKNFCAYGNLCYKETIIYGMPKFFEYYDSKFRASDAILTLDYPLLQDTSYFDGIDRIYEYLKGTFLEQTFLQKFEKRNVQLLLSRMEPMLQEGIFNVMRDVMFAMACSYLCTGTMEQWKLTEPMIAKIALSVTDELPSVLQNAFYKYLMPSSLLEKTLYSYMQETITEIASEIQYCMQQGILYQRLSPLMT